MQSIHAQFGEGIRGRIWFGRGYRDKQGYAIAVFDLVRRQKMPPRRGDRATTRNDRPYSGCRGSRTRISAGKDSSDSPDGIFLNPFEQSLELRPRQPHHPVLNPSAPRVHPFDPSTGRLDPSGTGLYPGEAALFQHLVDHHHPGSVPDQDLQSGATPGTEHHRHPGMRIQLQLGLHDQRQRVRRENSAPRCFLIRLVLCISMAPGVEGSHCPPRHLWRAVAAVGSCPPWS